MKKKLTAILAMILCAVITVAAIGTNTAYAASKTPLKVTFKGKTVTLTKDITKAATTKVNTLTKKWGKPKKEITEANELWDGCATYSWKKGETDIYCILPFGEGFGSNQKSIHINTRDKNVKVFGIKVGMKQAIAKKILENLGGETTDKGEYGSTVVDLSEAGGIWLSCSYSNGKVDFISCVVFLA